MGKQRTPQRQRPGRRMPHRGPAAAPAVEVQSQPVAEADPRPNANDSIPDAEARDSFMQDALVQDAVLVPDVAEAETPETVPEPSAEPALDEPVEAAEAFAPAPEGADIPEETAAVGEPQAQEIRSEELRSEEIHPEVSPAEASAETKTASDPAMPGLILPVPAVATPDAAGPSTASADRPAGARAAFRFAFAPARIDVEGIGVVLANYMHNESVAVLSYMRALSSARSPADMIRLNVTEIQRAADASLTCWSDIARRTARGVPWQAKKAAA